MNCYFGCVNSNIEQKSTNQTWWFNINNNPMCAVSNFHPKCKTYQLNHRPYHPFMCSAGSTCLTVVVIPRHHPNVFTSCHTINCFLVIWRKLLVLIVSFPILPKELKRLHIKVVSGVESEPTTPFGDQKSLIAQEGVKP